MKCVNFGAVRSKVSGKQLSGVIIFIPILLANAVSANAQRTNIALVGGAGWASIPVAFSDGNGTFNVTNDGVPSFPTWEATPGVTVLTGDFNGDGKTDIALVGGAGWGSIPVAFSNGNGTFIVSNESVASFPAWAATPGVKALAGDFNGDGRTDIALVGGAGWASIPIAFSNGDGTFTVTNDGVPSFATWEATPGVKALTGDFNGDGRTDIALVGGAGWASIPVAFSNGNGSFTVTNYGVSSFAAWEATPGVEALTGDFNGDGRTDIALVGGAGWASIPVAFSNGNGTFNVTNDGVPYFATWEATPGVKALTGDFNGDGKTDIALVGGAGWASIPVAFSNGDGSFNVTNEGVASFPTWEATPGVKALKGDFNGDGKTDIALVGGAGWASIPVAFSNGDGTFNVTNDGVSSFATWEATPGVKALTGHF